MQRTLAITLIPALVLLAGCEPRDAADTGGAPVTAEKDVVYSEIPEDAVALVNGYAITQGRYDAYVTQRQNNNQNRQINPANEPPEAALNELVAAELVYRDAMARGLNTRPEIAAALEALERSLLTQAALKDHMDANPVTDEQIQKTYDERIASQSRPEMHLKHILTETREAADQALAELNSGKEFDAVLAELSTGTDKETGGDLGWVQPDGTDPAVVAAVSTLEKGHYTTEPVETEYGFHIVMLVDRRETPPPALDTVRPQLEQFLQQLAVQDYIFGLRDKADIRLRPQPVAGE